MHFTVINAHTVYYNNLVRINTNLAQVFSECKMAGSKVNMKNVIFFPLSGLIIIYLACYLNVFFFFFFFFLFFCYISLKKKKTYQQQQQQKKKKKKKNINIFEWKQKMYQLNFISWKD